MRMGKKGKAGEGGHVGRGRKNWCSEEPQGRVMTLHRTDTVLAARCISVFCPAVSDQFHGKLIWLRAQFGQMQTERSTPLVKAALIEILIKIKARKGRKGEGVERETATSTDRLS